MPGGILRSTPSTGSVDLFRAGHVTCWWQWNRACEKPGRIVRAEPKKKDMAMAGEFEVGTPSWEDGWRACGRLCEDGGIAVLCAQDRVMVRRCRLMLRTGCVR